MPKYNKKKLDLIDEKLIKLPDDIDKYTNLKQLDCRDNKITSLDNLPPKLTLLHCIFNPFKYDFEPTLENIRNYNASRILSSNT